MTAKRKFASPQTRKNQQEGYLKYLREMGRTGGRKAAESKRVAKTKISLAPVKGVNE